MYSVVCVPPALCYTHHTHLETLKVRRRGSIRVVEEVERATKYLVRQRGVFQRVVHGGHDLVAGWWKREETKRQRERNREYVKAREGTQG